MTANRYLHPADERAARVNKPSVSYKWAGLDPEIVRRCEMHDELVAALREISTTVAPKGSHAEIMKRIADRALAKVEA